MKINPNVINKVYQTQTKSGTNTKEISVNKNVDKVEVSTAAKRKVSLQSIKHELTSSVNNDFSKEKISELKALVQSGKYDVNHRKVAEALIAFSEMAGSNDD